MFNLDTNIPDWMIVAMAVYIFITLICLFIVFCDSYQRKRDFFEALLIVIFWPIIIIGMLLATLIGRLIEFIRLPW